MKKIRYSVDINPRNPGSRRIERVVIYGLQNEPSSVTIANPASGSDERALDFAYDARVGAMTVRKPGVCVVDDFDLRIRDATTS